MNTTISRRLALKTLGLGAGLSSVGFVDRGAQAAEAASGRANRGSKAVKITKVRAITCATQGTIRFVVIRVDTSEPGLYGLGCGTYNQRPLTVVTAVNEYLDPFARGRDVDDIEDIWQNAYTSSYWRNGPVMNNALSGLDLALWDIKGKRTQMPVYQLIGGRARFAVDTYTHCSAGDLKQLEDQVKARQAEGYRHIRIQPGGYGALHLSKNPDFRAAGFGLPGDQHMDALPYLKAVPKMFAHIRSTCGETVELLHDIHERVEPNHAINLCRELEQYRPFFIEDPFSPEQNGWFAQLRARTSVPIAMGELFNSPHEWVPLLKDRLIDYLRVHITQAGGFTPARKMAALAEWFGVRSAWHGPGDLSPIGHAANIHLDLNIHNFGIQETTRFNDATREVFPGTHTIENGYAIHNDAPGWGVEFDEEKAKKYPLPAHPGYWEPVRRRDGTAVRP
ncbi:MAG: enolase C-terminal domain-like protein [Opitutaceae bacterium]|nr:enolase C-terminal domain-like protein [Opitutaceae bacterium]